MSSTVNKSVGRKGKVIENDGGWTETYVVLCATLHFTLLLSYFTCLQEALSRHIQQSVDTRPQRKALLSRDYMERYMRCYHSLVELNTRMIHRASALLVLLT